MMRRAFIGAIVPALMLIAVAGAARADAVERLREFGTAVKSGQAAFTQTVTSADGRRRKVSSGQFEFQRPDRFRFAYAKPFEQLIVSDGRKVWVYDADLNQASSRALAQAIGATPAALLAGDSFERDFALIADASQDGLEWVRATPRAKDAALDHVRIGFRGAELAAVEIVDGFGQRSALRFEGFVPNASLPASRFRFVPPAGAAIVEQ